MIPCSDAFSSSTGCRSGLAIAPRHQAATHPSRFAPSNSPSLLILSSSSNNDNESDITNNDVETTSLKRQFTTTGVDKIFSAVDLDGSGAIDLEEYYLHLSSAGYSKEAIQRSFWEMDRDGNGEISRDEFQTAITTLQAEEGDCPMGYWLNSVEQSCQPLGPVGRISQKIENLGPLKKVSKKITNLFGVDRQAIRKKGVSFALAYSIISNMNGALSLSVAWYMTVKRTGLSPLAPGQKKSLLASYAMIYGALQLLKPFRVAAAIAMSKLSADYLEMTQEKFNCSRSVAIGCQFMLGQIMMGITFFVGVTIVSFLTGVPIRG
ncbi:hypothetical protein ACHAXR_007387 [Thalassiosira sp. AJA248-18]